jgi:CRP-like cAMP-binding protein
VSSELERFPLLAGLSEDERRDLAQELEWLSFEAGASIFIEGDAADGLLLLLDGRVRLTSSVEACTPCRILRLRREGFQRLAKASPHVACRILEGVVRESADLVGRELEAPRG